MQVNEQVSVEALAGVLADFVTRLKRIGEAGTLELATTLDLSYSQLCALFIVDGSERPPALNEVAARLGLSLAATGRAIDALVREGLVSRQEDERDRRVKRISLTDAGDDVILRLTGAHHDGVREFAAMLTEPERTSLFTALAPILTRTEPRTRKPKESR